jgi:hypothetical protein
MMDDANVLRLGGDLKRTRPRIAACSILSLFTFAACLFATPLLAQTAERLDAGGDAEDARIDAMLATPYQDALAPLSNLYATSPGLEQQAPAPQWRINTLAPLTFDSNPEQSGRGSASTLGTSPFGGVSWAAPVPNLPLRATLNASAVLNRYFNAPDAENERVTVSGRLQYVDPNNDQAFSPYFAIAPRWEFADAFSSQNEARQDFNLGVNKRFNFDGSFQPVPVSGDTSAATVWTLGLTAFVQRRLREPQLSSSAVFVIPSVSYVISKEWNANFAVEFLSRWYDPDSVGQRSRDLEAMPIATLEYVIPPSFLGGDKIARFLGRPALDMQGSHLKVWSTVPGATFNQWEARAAIKMGWRF